MSQELVELGHEDIDPTATEKDEIADKLEDFEEHSMETRALVDRRAEIQMALDRIKSNVYGHCEECGEKIEEDRLEANPAARTCTVHM